MSNEVNPFSPAPAPATALGRYRMLSARAGVRVSPLCLGAMSIGDQWAKIGMGAMDKESSFKLLDAFYDAGGNFIDTANNYQQETSEMFIGEWMETRGNRDEMVIATKVWFNLNCLLSALADRLSRLHIELPHAMDHMGALTLTGSVLE
ncbi:Aldo/keto reductase [Peniophora sp. CONT]|nr:Aldo/keto reductase [Peniophora sp. CONT]